MSVLKNKRSLSDLEFYHNAVSLRKEVTELLLRDFGVRDKVRQLKFVHNNLTNEELKVLHKIINKHDGMVALATYPEWLIQHLRENVLFILASLIRNITSANTIYPVHEKEYFDRRAYQTEAIANCEQLLQEFQYIITVLPLDANKFMRYVGMIEKEIGLLKGWRKSDNRILTHIKDRQKAKEQAESESKEKEEELKEN